jgi:hypothetical protein
MDSQENVQKSARTQETLGTIVSKVLKDVSDIAFPPATEQ